MKTSLSFKFVEDYRDCTKLAIIDTSSYNTQIPITCPIIEIQVPNFSSFLRQEYTPQTTFLMTTGSLTLGEGNSLPTGLYRIRMSINPNDQIYVQYNWLNICCDMSNLAQVMCNDSCDDNIDLLMKLKQDLEAAKILVELCGDTVRGLGLYNATSAKITKLLETAGCSTKCTSC